MREVVTKVYLYNELSEGAKEKARDWYRENNDMYFLEDDMNYHLEEILEENKIKPVDVRVRYSLSYCQGDGASFTGEVEWKAWRVTIDTNSWGNHYMHWNSVEVKEMTSLKTDKDAPEATVDKFTEILHSIGKDLEEYGYGCIEAENSDENVADLLEVNEYEFLEDGTRA